MEINHIKHKVFGIVLYFLSVHVNAQNTSVCIEKVWTEAKKDVGVLESKNNTGAVQKYAKYWNTQNPKNQLILTSPYCGLSLYYWYAKAGIETNIPFTPRAVNWQIYCIDALPIWKMTVQELEDLPKGGVIIYKNSWGGNHVGLFEKYDDYFLYTIEGNTSNARSVTKYAKRSEGVFYLKTRISSTSLKPLYYCPVLPQSTEFKGK
jgi:hypothetical protein